MPIFGQVWLWSSLAFLLGALLCWALVALPARRRVAELESRLAAHRRPAPPRRPKLPRRPAEPVQPVGSHDRDLDDRPPLIPGLRRFDEEHEEFHGGESLTRAYALPELTRDEPANGLRTPPEPVSDSMGSALDDGPVEPPAEQLPALPTRQPGAAATQYLNVSSTSLGSMPESAEDDRGWFDDDRKDGAGASSESSESSMVSSTELSTEPEPGTPAPGELDGRLVDDSGVVAEGAAPEDGGTVFTQHTHPISGDMIKQLDAAGKTAGAGEAAGAGELVDDLADSDVSSDISAGGGERTVESEPAEPNVVQATTWLAAEPPTSQTVQPTVQPAVQPTEALPKPGDLRTETVPGRGRSGGETTTSLPGVEVTEPSGRNPLPKRVPSKPPQRNPFGIQTAADGSPPSSMPSLAAAASSSSMPSPPAPSSSTASSTASSSADVSRSLFEPVVPAEEGPSVPATNPRRGNGSSGRGPFGPGSAMPLPGGGSPSPEFTIKASVSALRYCTPESPQFGRTVAEVWFKTTADAERVGFRPVG